MLMYMYHYVDMDFDLDVAIWRKCHRWIDDATMMFLLEEAIDWNERCKSRDWKTRQSWPNDSPRSSSRSWKNAPQSRSGICQEGIQEALGSQPGIQPDSHSGDCQWPLE